MKPDKFELEKLVRDYKDAKAFAEKTSARATELKTALTEYVKEHGVPDDRGHKWLAAGDSQVKHERRVGKRFDIGAAQSWAKDIGIWDEIKQVVEVITEDDVLKYSWEHPEHHDTVMSFYSESESWAFKIVNEKSYED
jgi:hypothetical protein